MPTTALAEPYEDCEQPPEIAHGSARLTVDDNEEYVTAHYTCKAGYRLQEPQLAQLRCSIETDEWDSTKLPVCIPGECQCQCAFPVFIFQEDKRVPSLARVTPGMQGS